ncbi:roadblock/LC7 domain-containing protein [Streptomyces sp. MP131-18]|uniref:roadblock/LC7 domain-containing protein n=1 Tax=Streptomyces sp. MP131-18 TaxID=1857892 RepID=UPI00097BDDB4|nr:roadblock/LC7 domain-containing protein [Streptomyces sp. MP131-18]
MDMDMDWVIAGLDGLKGVRHVIVLASDGLMRAKSPSLEREAADRLAAACSGLQALGLSLAEEFGSPPGQTRQLMFELDGCMLFVRRAAEGSHLAVLADPQIDPGVIATEMQSLVQRMGERTLTTPARQDPPTS